MSRTILKERWMRMIGLKPITEHSDWQLRYMEQWNIDPEDPDAAEKVDLAIHHYDEYKSVHGVRPRWMDYGKMSVEDLRIAVDELGMYSNEEDSNFDDDPLDAYEADMEAGLGDQPELTDVDLDDMEKTHKAGTDDRIRVDPYSDEFMSEESESDDWFSDMDLPGDEGSEPLDPSQFEESVRITASQLKEMVRQAVLKVLKENKK